LSLRREVRREVSRKLPGEFKLLPPELPAMATPIVATPIVATPVMAAVTAETVIDNILRRGKDLWGERCLRWRPRFWPRFCATVALAIMLLALITMLLALGDAVCCLIFYFLLIVLYFVFVVVNLIVNKCYTSYSYTTLHSYTTSYSLYYYFVFNKSLVTYSLLWFPKFQYLMYLTASIGIGTQ
jgi:hypothetical protein